MSLELNQRRKEAGAVCWVCKSPNYELLPPPFQPNIRCNSCGRVWIGPGDGGVYAELAEEKAEMVGTRVKYSNVESVTVELDGLDLKKALIEFAEKHGHGIPEGVRGRLRVWEIGEDEERINFWDGDDFFDGDLIAEVEFRVETEVEKEPE